VVTAHALGGLHRGSMLLLALVVRHPRADG
jgi:hypothetical protein